jgi:gamma-glutamyltranspeptidase
MRKSDGTVVHIDAREEAPASAHETMLILNNATVARGGVSVAIPGELKLLDYLYNTYSSRNLTWFELFEPTINFTRDGFEMHEYLYKMTSTRTEMISRDPELSKILLDSNMTAIPVVRVTLFAPTNFNFSNFRTCTGRNH